MPTCPSCGYDNTIDAVVCVKCSVPLVSKTTRLVQTTLEIPDNIVSARRFFPKQTGTLGGTSIALHIDESQEPVILEVVRQAILGRFEANSRSQPRVDLTPFGAYEKGVSRLHAIIRRTENGLMIEDLASTNGSALNDIPLDPYIPKPLKSGDQLKLSKLGIEIRFKDNAT
jgi:hypothetical protein